MPRLKQPNRPGNRKRRAPLFSDQFRTIIPANAWPSLAKSILQGGAARRREREAGSARK